MKVYHMIIEHKTSGERKEYLSAKQGSAPTGYKCIGVCGYHEEKRKKDTKE